MSRLQAIIDAENKETIENYSGSQDALYDIEWAKKEGISVITCEPEAIEYIAKTADGGMRDAITMLDKCVSLSQDLTLENVLKTAGREDCSMFINFMLNLELKSPKQAVENIETVYNSGKDLKQFMKDFSKFILDVAKYGMYGTFEYISLPQTLEENISKLAGSDVYSVLDFVVTLNNQIKWDNDPKTLVELSILTYCRKE